MVKSSRADGPVFGTVLRGHRLRFSYVKSRNCFIRVSVQGDNFLTELRPNCPDALVKGSVNGREYFVIEDSESLFKSSPVLAAIKAVEEPLELVLNELGEESG